MSAGSEPASREARLAQALRANLRRRKSPSTPSPPPETCDAASRDADPSEAR